MRPGGRTQPRLSASLVVSLHAYRRPESSGRFVKAVVIQPARWSKSLSMDGAQIARNIQDSAVDAE